MMADRMRIVQCMAVDFQGRYLVRTNETSVTEAINAPMCSQSMNKVIFGEIFLRAYANRHARQ